MAVEVGQVFGGAVGGAVVNAVLVPLIGQRRERRDLRADVLRSIAAVEGKRWAPATLEEFREATGALRAAGLVANVRRDIVDEYIYLASVGWFDSETSWDLHPDPEMGSFIQSEIAELINDQSLLLIDHLWAPRRTYLSVRRRIATLSRRQGQLKDDMPKIRWDPPRA